MLTQPVMLYGHLPCCFCSACLPVNVLNSLFASQCVEQHVLLHDLIVFVSHCVGGAQVEDLKRFMPQILHITQPGSQAAAVGNKNVGSAGSLADVFSFSG